MEEEVIDTVGHEVPVEPIRIGAQVAFTPAEGNHVPGLFDGRTHLGLIIGTRRGRPILRIFSPMGARKDPTFEHTGSEGTWTYLDEVE